MGVADAGAARGRGRARLSRHKNTAEMRRRGILMAGRREQRRGGEGRTVDASPRNAGKEGKEGTEGTEGRTLVDGFSRGRGRSDADWR